MVVIALVGNPFSPRYARARERGNGAPWAFCALNVAVYARRASAWCLTERALRDGDRSCSGLAIGASTMEWKGDDLVIGIDERTAPLGRRVVGKVVLHPEVRTRLELTLDARGDHRWWPVAPLARVTVDLPSLGVSFKGHGYHDVNAGRASLEDGFAHWHWGRARMTDGAIVTYDVVEASSARRSLAFKVGTRGTVEALEGLAAARLPRSRWGLSREARVDQPHRVRVVRSLEDGPFYSRALVETHLDGHPAVSMQESLDARRLGRSWVRRLTPFRMRNGD